MEKSSKNTGKPSFKNFSEEDDWHQIGETFKRVRANKWIPVKPTVKQLKYLLIDTTEAFFGGAAGPGKSTALLIGSAMYVDHKSYNAILFRKTFKNLKGNLIPESKRWWLNTEAHWDGVDYKWTFPSGATISFGYLNNENDHFNYQSNEYQYIAFDELPEIRPEQYRFMFTRLRRTEEQRINGIPLRVRAAGNPVGPYVQEYKIHFNLPKGDPDRPFIPAFIDDNPYLDQDTYKTSLRENLDPVTLARMMEGDWTVKDEGGFFKRSWFKLTNTVPSGMRAVRYWDKAATREAEGRDPAYTAGVLMATKDGRDIYVMDVRHFRGTPLDVRRTIRQTAELDYNQTKGKDRLYNTLEIYIEQEPGSAGVEDMETYRAILQGYPFRPDKVTGSKEQRALLFSSLAEAGQVYYYVPLDKRVTWDITGYLDELATFPEGKYKDRVDSSSACVNKLVRRGKKPKARI